MQGKKIRFSKSGTTMQGTVELVYQEAIASGTNEYTGYTMLCVRNEHGDTLLIYPRDVTWVEPERMVVVQISDINDGQRVVAMSSEKIDQVAFEEWAAKSYWRWHEMRQLWFSNMEGFKNEDELKEIYKRKRQGSV